MFFYIIAALICGFLIAKGLGSVACLLIFLYVLWYYNIQPFLVVLLMFISLPIMVRSIGWLLSYSHKSVCVVSENASKQIKKKIKKSSK